LADALGAPFASSINMLIRKTLIMALAVTIFAFGMVAQAEKPEWQRHLEWAAATNDGPDHLGCAEHYADLAPRCVQGGGRACVMCLAIEAAKNHDDDRAFRLALITECHDPAAVQSLAEAGHETVAEYLRTRKASKKGLFSIAP
jgi:hypothetical protein